MALQMSPFLFPDTILIEEMLIGHLMNNLFSSSQLSKEQQDERGAAMSPIPWDGAGWTGLLGGRKRAREGQPEPELNYQEEEGIITWKLQLR